MLSYRSVSYRAQHEADLVEIDVQVLVLSDGCSVCRIVVKIYNVIQKKWSGVGTPAPLFP